MKIVSHSPEQTRRLGTLIGRLAEPGDIYLLNGNLGSGKTCLTQGIAWGLGSTDYALSPTFVLMREIKGRLPLYHMDLYRLDYIQEISDLGLDDYFYGKGICVIEWAEKGKDILPDDHMSVFIEFISDNERSFTFQPQGKRYRALVKEIKELYKQGLDADSN